MKYRFLILLVLLPGSAWALDADGRYLMHGAGAVSCGTFVQAENGTVYDAVGTRGDMLAWAQGYLSFYNRHTEDVYDIYGYTDTKGIEVWLYNFCRSNPLQHFADALEALIKQLYSRRIISAPR